MSLSATLFGRDSIVFKATNVLGLGVPGLLDKWFGAEPPPAQRLGEISEQTAKEAEPRVIVWGRVRPIGGNLIHCQAPVKRMVKVKTDSGGKGGSKKKTQKVEHVFRSYAMGVCEGPITRFVRIWRNNKLVYDARGNAWGNDNNPVFLKTFRLYTGEWAQMPDATLEKIWGVGNVPAYRGTAYMVSIDEDLTETAGMVPQWLFEVERAEGVYYTSKPYRAVSEEALSAAPDVDLVDIRGQQLGFGDEAVSVVPSVSSVHLTDPTSSMEYLSVEPGVSSVELSGAPITSIEFIAVVPAVTRTGFSITYDDGDPDCLAVEPAVLGVEIE